MVQLIFFSRLFYDLLIPSHIGLNELDLCEGGVFKRCICLRRVSPF